MENQEITRQVQRLDTLFNKVAEATNNDFDLQSHWARYLCIMVAGLVENGLKEIFTKYIENKSAKPIVKYSLAQLSKLNNPKAEKVCELVGSFKSEWRHDLEIYLNELGRSDAIDSIMNNRNQLSHGKDVGVSIVSVKGYFKKIVDVLEFIELKVK